MNNNYGSIQQHQPRVFTSIVKTVIKFITLPVKVKPTHGQNRQQRCLVPLSTLSAEMLNVVAGETTRFVSMYCCLIACNKYFPKQECACTHTHAYLHICTDDCIRSEVRTVIAIYKQQTFPLESLFKYTRSQIYAVQFYKTSLSLLTNTYLL